MVESMRLTKTFLFCLIIFLLLILSLWYFPIPENASGTEHPTYKTMLHSGSDVMASNTTRVLSYLFGLGVIMMFYFFILFGSDRKKSSGNLKLWINLGFIVYLVVYTLSFFSYLNYETTGHDNFFFGWPTPTAWMIYGMWSAPMILVLVYVIKFKEWILNEEDELEFQRILARRKEREAK